MHIASPVVIFGLRTVVWSAKRRHFTAIAVVVAGAIGTVPRTVQVGEIPEQSITLWRPLNYWTAPVIQFILGATLPIRNTIWIPSAPVGRHLSRTLVMSVPTVQITGVDTLGPLFTVGVFLNAVRRILEK